MDAGDCQCSRSEIPVAVVTSTSAIDQADRRTEILWCGSICRGQGQVIPIMAELRRTYGPQCPPTCQFGRPYCRLSSRTGGNLLGTTRLTCVFITKVNELQARRQRSSSHADKPTCRISSFTGTVVARSRIQEAH
jgi:hypothetical protein